MDAVTFIKERERMCHYQHHTDGRYGCINCPITSYAKFETGKSGLIQCEQYESENPELFVSLVKRWSEEHKIVTNAMKFTEVFGEKTEFVQAPPSWWCEEYKKPESEDK